jgi:tripartite-type tricarboxylate transporter receptor subunit TctC
LPDEIRARMNRDVRTVLADEATRRWCERNGLEAAPSSPDAFVRYMAEETTRFAAFVRETNMTLD